MSLSMRQARAARSTAECPPTFERPMTQAFSSPQVSSRVHPFHNAWTTLGLFTLLSLVCYIDRYMLGALLTPLKADLHLTDEQLGRLYVIFTVAYIAIVPAAGYLGDRFQRKWYVLAALVLWSFATVGSGWAKSYAELLVWRALVGLGEGVFSSLSLSWLADTFTAARRPTAFAVMASTSQVSAWIAYHFGALIAAESGWSQAFFLAGVPGLILALAVPFLREPSPGAAEPEPHAVRAKPSWQEIRSFITEARYLLFVTGYTVRMVAAGGLFFWGAVYLHRNYGLSNTHATSFIGATYFLTGVPGIFIGGYVAGRLAQRFRGAYAYWLGLMDTLACAAVLLVLAWQPTLSVAQAILLSQMFFAGAGWGVINPLLFEFAPVRIRSMAVSVALAVSSAGGAFLAMQLIGLFSDHVGIHVPCSWCP